jgi:hypothetical protein
MHFSTYQSPERGRVCRVLASILGARGRAAFLYITKARAKEIMMKSRYSFFKSTHHPLQAGL